MTVYVDNAHIPATVQNGGRPLTSTWCHLTADTKAELHVFAARLGLRRAWFQDDQRPGVLTIPGSWHYDLTARRRAAAVRLGAVECTRQEFAQVIRTPGREGREHLDATAVTTPSVRPEVSQP